MSRTYLRIPLAIAAAVGVALCIAGPASAHIHTDPAEVKAGTEDTVGFIIEHGCDGSPTTRVELQLPTGVTGIAGVDGDGFTASVDGQVVTFSGGTLPNDTEQAFEVTFTAPADAGTIDIPLVQTCEEGSTDWIEPEVEGQPEPEFPAPQLVIAANADATTSTTAADSSTTEAGPTTTAAPAEATTTAPSTTVVVDDDEDDSNNTPLIIGAVVVVLAAIGGAVYYLRSKQGPAGDADDDAAAGPADDGTDPGAPTGPSA